MGNEHIFITIYNILYSGTEKIFIKLMASIPQYYSFAFKTKYATL